MRASTQNKIAATSIAAVGAGAAMMFFLDPDRGKTRRAFVQNKATRLARESGRFFAKASRDLEHRALGVMAETRSRISHDAASDDAVLVVPAECKRLVGLRAAKGDRGGDIEEICRCVHAEHSLSAG